MNKDAKGSFFLLKDSKNKNGGTSIMAMWGIIYIL